jgi:hypothetical protein
MKQRSRIGLFVAATISGLAVGVAGSPAAVADIGPNTLQEHTYTCDFTVDPSVCVKPTDGAYSHWVTFAKNGQDSPGDSNTRALVVHTPSNNAAAYDYTEVYSKVSLNINKPASQVHNLSFDAYKPALQGGSPRIDVFFTNPLDSDGSDYVAIDAGNCQRSLSSSGGTWVRADATGQKALGCTIYTSNGTAYSSDGTHSAWANFVAANLDAQVAYTFMVFDQPSGQTGVDYRVDRIALGTGKMYNAGNAPVTCGSEAAC